MHIYIAHIYYSTNIWPPRIFSVCFGIRHWIMHRSFFAFNWWTGDQNTQMAKMRCMHIFSINVVNYNLYSIFICHLYDFDWDRRFVSNGFAENTSCYILHDVRHVSPHYGSGIIRQHENLTLYSQEENERGSVQLNRAVTSNECLFRLTWEASLIPSWRIHCTVGY